MFDSHRIAEFIGCNWLLLALLLMMPAIILDPAQAQTFTVLYSFSGTPNDGAWPLFGNVLLDQQGNLYGTTLAGGAFNAGTVFKLNPSGVETVLHSFGKKPDGLAPFAGLILDTQGNLWGTTAEGGNGRAGPGTVFEVTQSGVETAFPIKGGGRYPTDTLIRDQQGNLYGTDFVGGGRFCGNVFKLTAGKFTILHWFTGGFDGCDPWGGLVMDQRGNLFGTTTISGSFNGGTVFKIGPGKTFTVLHDFGQGTDACCPSASLIMDSTGTLFGTASGGAFGNGAVYEVTPSGTEKVLYSFTGGADGGGPSGPLLIDARGHLYGTTEGGGVVNSTCPYGCGVLFELAPNGTEKVLYSFTGGVDGWDPEGGLIADQQGNLVGTARFGGNPNCVQGCGVIFRITPQPRLHR